MRKVYRRSQIRQILGFPILGPALHKYGIPYTGAAGTLNLKEDEDLLDYALTAVERFTSEIHIVSFMEDGRILNRLVEDASYCMLYPGNNDPQIEFSIEFLWEDVPPWQVPKYSDPIVDEFKPTFGQLYAMNWALKKFQKKLCT